MFRRNYYNNTGDNFNPSLVKKHSKNRSTTTTTTITPYLLYTSLTSNFNPISIIVIGILLYIIFVQYSVIQTKDAAILTILTTTTTTTTQQQQQQQQPATASSSHQSLQTTGSHNTILLQQNPRNLFNNEQYRLYETFQKNQCSSSGITSTTSTTTGSSVVGVFPLYKPSTDSNIIQKIQLRSQIRWKPYTSTILRKVTYPIFVVSLPKSGTTSIYKYFKCGYQEACHNWIQTSTTTIEQQQQQGDNNHKKPKPTLLGKCIEQNIINNIPPFDNCGPYDVYTDSGYLNYDHDSGEKCFYPSIDGLEAIYESYPNITFVNVVRNTAAWYESIRTWSQASLFVRLRLCNATGFPNGQSNRNDIMNMYDNFNTMIRQFVHVRPSIHYIEVQLESNETGRILQDKTGIDSACWKVCKPQHHHCDGDEPQKKQQQQQQRPITGKPKQVISEHDKVIRSNKAIRAEATTEEEEEEDDADEEGDDKEEEVDNDEDDEGIE